MHWTAVQLFAGEPILVSEMQVVLIDSVDVPASQDLSLIHI